MTRTPRLIAAALGALLAWPATANQLLNEDWIAKASYEQVQKAIAGGADVNAENRSLGYTPLMAASRHGNLLAMEALLDAGVDPNRQAAETGLVAMHFAATGKAVSLLFDHGASVSIRGENGLTPLHLVAREGTKEAVQALIRRGADVNAGSPPVDNTPLHDAAKYAQPVVVQILLEAGAEINARNRSDVTPLYKAAKFNSPEVVELLLDAGADPTIRTKNRRFNAADVAKADNRKLRGHPVMARLEAAAAGTTPASPSADPASPGCAGYIVQATDRRLGDVAEKVLGDRSRWTEIARLNGITAQAPHRVGQCLALP